VLPERLGLGVNLNLPLGASLVHCARPDPAGSAHEPARDPEIADARAAGYRGP
jgi:hypothetical protein